MHKLSTILAATAFIVGAGLFGANAKAAVVAAPNAIDATANTLKLVQNVQRHFWRGRAYCWYDNGSHGPGWYGCVDPRRQPYGYDWGGPDGWHGWYHHRYYYKPKSPYYYHKKRYIPPKYYRREAVFPFAAHVSGISP